MAFTCFNDLNIAYTGITKTRKINVNSNGTVDLPGDFIQYRKIGVLNENGEVMTLVHNKDLTSYGSPFANREQDAVDEAVRPVAPDRADLNYYGYYDQDRILTLLGVDSGPENYGEFKIDEENSVILLSPTFPYGYIILEYLSSPSEDNDFLVPIHFKSAIIAFLRWQDIVSLPPSRKSNISEKNYRERLYYRELRGAIQRYNPIRTEEANVVTRLGTKLAVKS